MLHQACDILHFVIIKGHSSIIKLTNQMDIAKSDEIIAKRSKVAFLRKLNEQ